MCKKKDSIQLFKRHCYHNNTTVSNFLEAELIKNNITVWMWKTANLPGEKKWDNV